MNRGGYTVLETMLALALTAVVATAVRGVVTRAGATRDHALDVADRTDGARTALLQIAADVEATVAPDPTAPPRLTIEPAATHGASWPQLHLTVAGSDALPRSHHVTYAIAAGTRLVRHDDGPETLLLDGVRAFRVRALQNEQWLERWDADALPRAVEIALTVASDDGSAREFATVVPVPLGAWR